MDNDSRKPGLTKKMLMLGLAAIVIVVAAALGFMMMAADGDRAADIGTRGEKSANAVEEYDPGVQVEEPQQPPLEQPEVTNENTHTIVYTSGGCYEPAGRTINHGDTIVFSNNDANGEYMWPASDNHPSHTIYPEFDAKRAIPSGGTYRFTFTKKGTWAYHDHIMSSCSGTITVR